MKQLLEYKPLIVITLGQIKNYNIRTITVTKVFYLVMDIKLDVCEG
jgi:hypothetical protein